MDLYHVIYYYLFQVFDYDDVVITSDFADEQNWKVVNENDNLEKLVIVVSMFNMELEKPSFNTVNVNNKMDKLPVATSWVQLEMVNHDFVVNETMDKHYRVDD